MIEIREEAWAAVRAELAPLFLVHHNELTDAEYKSRLPLDVDWDAYARIDRAGNLLLVTARENGRIIGYTVSMLHPHLHYRTALMCHVDTYWLHPDHREPDGDSLETIASTGAQLLVETEDRAAARGAVKMINHTRFWADNQKLFDLLGFKAVERLSTKWIGK